MISSYIFGHYLEPTIFVHPLDIPRLNTSSLPSILRCTMIPSSFIAHCHIQLPFTHVFKGDGIHPCFPLNFTSRLLTFSTCTETSKRLRLPVIRVVTIVFIEILDPYVCTAQVSLSHLRLVKHLPVKLVKVRRALKACQAMGWAFERALYPHRRLNIVHSFASW